MSNILWVDDRFDLVENWIYACRTLGHDVDFASNHQESLKIARRKGEQIDLALFDLVMPERGGRTLALELKGLLPRARQAIVTSYGDVDVEADVEEDKDLIIIDRDKLPLPGDKEELERFIAGLVGRKEHDDLGPPQRETKRRVRDITYEEFRKESPDGRLALNEEAQKDPEVAEILEKGGFYWFLVCGDDIEKARNPSEVWSSAKIEELARTKGRAPFQFFTDMDVDDFSPRHCNADLSDYPFVRIELSSDVSLDIHFDTGNAENFFNLKSVEKFVQAQRLSPARISIRGKKLRSWRGSLDSTVIENPISQATEVFNDIEIIAVKDWESTPLVQERQCPQGKCANRDKNPHNVDYCHFRQHGLLGRRLQRCTNRYVLISPENAQVGLIDERAVQVLLKGAT